MRITHHFALAAGLLGATPLLPACAEPDAPEQLSIGFFGVSKTNAYAQGTFLGVQAAAKADGATATFVDGEFDAQKQVQQVRDAIESRQFDIIVMQANDNLALQAPLQEAVDAGLTVVVESFIVGPDLGTIEPQVDGAISVVGLPGTNGAVLAELGVAACAVVETKPCKVAYLEGFKWLTIDTVRTAAVKAGLATDGSIELVASVEGGYTPESGRAAFADVLQANPDVDVVIGSSQAITGAAEVAGDSDIHFIGNGASVANVETVRSGAWFAIYVYDTVANGTKAAELGLAHAHGESVEFAVDIASLAPNSGKGTKAALDAVDYMGGYKD